MKKETAVTIRTEGEFVFLGGVRVIQLTSRLFVEGQEAGEPRKILVPQDVLKKIIQDLERIG